jgi:hypothetical protein
LPALNNEGWQHAGNTMMQKLTEMLLAISVTVFTLGCGSQDAVKPFLGRWDMTLKARSQEYASWLEISEQKAGQPKIQMVGRWGNVRPLPKVDITQGEIEFVSPKEEEGRNDDMVFRGTIEGSRLVGTTTGPDGTPWQWTAVRASALDRRSAPVWGRAVVLFDGKDLSNWTLRDAKSTNGWKVENGVMTNYPPSTDLISKQQFKDFKLHVEFNCPRHSNSGVYLRGRYEVQIEDDSIQAPPSQRMGAVYGFVAPEPELPRQPGEWQRFDITLIGRRVTVAQNGQMIINNREIPGITGGALDSHEELPGPIYLQADHGEVSFRNIVITPANE